MSELSLVIDHVKSKNPNSNIYLVGFSLGSSYGVKFLGRLNREKKIQGMVSVSNPFDVFLAAQCLNRKSNFFYSKFVTKELVKKVFFNRYAIERRLNSDRVQVDFELLGKCNTTFEFDQVFTFKIVKENNSKDYYKTFSCHEDLAGVDVPVLFIQSKNDPISRFFKKN